MADEKIEKIETGKGRIVYLDVLRILATLAVICIHTATVDETDVFSSQFNSAYLWQSLVRWSVPAFVMISGALLLNPKRTVSIKKIYTRNIFRMLTAFFFWSFVYILADYYILEILSPASTLKDYYYLFLHGNYHMWFILTIIGVYAVTPIIKKIVEVCDTKLLKYLLIISFFFAALIPTLRAFYDIYFQLAEWGVDHQLRATVVDSTLSLFERINPSFLNLYVAYFVLGYYLAYNEISANKRKLIYILGIIGLLMGIFFARHNAHVLGTANERMFENYAINNFLISLALFVLLKYNIHIKSDKAKRIIAYISDRTFGIYLSHVLILTILSKYFSLSAMSFNPMISIPAIVILVFVLGLLVSIGISKIPVIGKYIE